MARLTKKESDDLKDQARLVYIHEGLTNQKELAKRIGVGEKTIGVWIKEGNWKNYFGSHDYIKGLLKENKHEEFTREIIQICYSKKELTYSETKYQMMFEVLENPSYINANILGKFFRSDLENYKD